MSRADLVSTIAQILEPWAFETKSWNATVARDDATAKAEQIAELVAARPAPAEDAVERVAASLAQQMEEQDEHLPSSLARERGLVWLDGWFDLRAALAAMQPQK